MSFIMNQEADFRAKLSCEDSVVALIERFHVNFEFHIDVDSKAESQEHDVEKFLGFIHAFFLRVASNYFYLK